MSAASRRISLLGAIAALAACGQEPGDQNVVITNEVPGNAEVEVLPPDESIGTPTDELENGAAEPVVNAPPVNGV